MRTIAIINQKGGVGKTTTSVNLSAALSALGRRVCVLDLDPQAHATLHLGIAPGRDDRSIYDVLTGSASLADVRCRVSDQLWVVGSHIDLAAAEVELAGVVGREMILRDKLRDDREDFDLLLVDCPPSLGVLTLNALSAVDEVIIPLQPHFLALHGLGKLLETVELVRQRINPRLRVTGIVLCMYDGATKLAAEVGQDIEDFLAHGREQRSPWSQAVLFQTRIRKNIRLAEAPSFGQSIFDYAADSNGAADYLALAHEIFLEPGPAESSASTAEEPAASGLTS
ncbi:MAG: ParA family protein [Pirellulales bacterium]|nr:ParA family protein [Pirellulales bacterium]